MNYVFIYLTTLNTLINSLGNHVFLAHFCIHWAHFNFNYDQSKVI